MKFKQFMVAATLSVCATVTHAQSAGSFILGGGWAYFMPQGGSHSLGNNATLDGLPVENNPWDGEGVKLTNSHVLSLSGTYFITDHLATELVLNMPSRIYLQATSEHQEGERVGSLQHKSMAFLLKYYFLEADQKLRPYLGLGISRTLFSKEKLETEPFVGEKIENSFSIKNQWEPVFNAGLSYRLSQRWLAGLSVSYMPLRTKARLRIPLADSTADVTTEPSIKLNSVIPYLTIGFCF